MNKIVEEWLASGDTKPCYFREKATNYVLIRAERTPDFEYLFYQCPQDEPYITQHRFFDFAGIYCRKDGKVYEARFDFLLPGQDADSRGTTVPILTQMMEDVKKVVEDRIGNDRRNLSITEITDRVLLEKLEDLYQYQAKEDALSRYFETREWHPCVFKCEYYDEKSRRMESRVLDYILDPVSYAQNEADVYIKENQEEILFALLRNEAIEKEYRLLMGDEDNPMHLVKKIKEAVSAVRTKFVDVTICKNGVTATFKVKAYIFCHYNNGRYTAPYMTLKNPDVFRSQFTGCSGFLAKEIVCIKSGKKELYRANDLE